MLPQLHDSGVAKFAKEMKSKDIRVKDKLSQWARLVKAGEIQTLPFSFLAALVNCTVSQVGLYKRSKRLCGFSGG